MTIQPEESLNRIGRYLFGEGLFNDLPPDVEPIAIHGLLLGMDVALRHPEWAQAVREADYASLGRRDREEADALVAACPIEIEAIT